MARKRKNDGLFENDTAKEISKSIAKKNDSKNLPTATDNDRELVNARAKALGFSKWATDREKALRVLNSESYKEVSDAINGFTFDYEDFNGEKSSVKNSSTDAYRFFGSYLKKRFKFDNRNELTAGENMIISQCQQEIAESMRINMHNKESRKKIKDDRKEIVDYWVALYENLQERNRGKK